MSAGCQTIRDLFPMVLLGEAEPDEVERFEEHLALCADCRAEADRHVSLLGTLSASEVPDPGHAYWDSFLPRLRNQMARQGLVAWVGSPRNGWAVAASVAGIFLLGALAALTPGPPARSGSRMALEFIASRTNPDTLKQALDEILPGSELSRAGKAAGELEVPAPAELQQALDSLIPLEEGDIYGMTTDLTPETRRWLVRTLISDRV
jgi:anti-sigma factor RsiW